MGNSYREFTLSNLARLGLHAISACCPDVSRTVITGRHDGGGLTCLSDLAARRWFEKEVAVPSQGIQASAKQMGDIKPTPSE